jgi:hypothetical protein
LLSSIFIQKCANWDFQTKNFILGLLSYFDQQSKRKFLLNKNRKLFMIAVFVKASSFSALKLLQTMAVLSMTNKYSINSFWFGFFILKISF